MAPANNTLEQVMLERSAANVRPPIADPTAAMPNAPTKVLPAWQRYITGQKMQQAYANGWEPNPMLIRVLGKR